MKSRKLVTILLIGAGVLVILVCLAPAVFPQDPGADALFAKANLAYSKGDYDTALARYREISEKYGVSAALFYNMANAWYHKKDLGQAVLHYQRALFLAPSARDARANLALAKKDFGIICLPESFWGRLFGMFSLNQWTWIASGAFACFCFLFFLLELVPKDRETGASRLPGALLKWGSVLCLAAFLCAGAGVFAHASDLKKAVVTGLGVRLQVSPFDAAQSAASLKQGKLVYTGKTYSGYVHVRDDSGRSGWVKDSDLTPVVPR